MHPKRTRLSKALSIIVISVAGLNSTGCQTWYKRGASGDDLAAARAECQSVTGKRDGSTFDTCMREAGWSQGNDGPDTEPQIRENKAPELAPRQPAAGPEATSVTPAQAPVPAPHSPAQSPAVTVASPAEPVVSAPTTPEPVAQGWFKFGADSGQMQTDLADCQSSYPADPVSCMRDKGWRPIRTRSANDSGSAGN